MPGKVKEIPLCCVRAHIQINSFVVFFTQRRDRSGPDSCYLPSSRRIGVVVLLCTSSVFKGPCFNLSQQ